jgi:hypothetical protein
MKRVTMWDATQTDDETRHDVWEPTMKRVTMWDATRLSRVTLFFYQRQLPQDRDDLLAREVSALAP